MPNKKTKKKRELNKKIYIPIFVLIIILMFSGFFFFARQSTLAQDFTITSITSTQIISKSTNLAGVQFIVNTIANGGGQKITGELSPTLFKGYTGYETKHPFNISISAIGETTDINIENLAQPIYRYSYYESGRFNSCSDKTKYSILQGLLGNKLCVEKIQDGILGRLQQDNTQFRGNITLESNNIIITQEISSQQSSVNFNDNGQTLATATWTGSLITGNGLPNYADIVPIYFPNVIQKWQLIRESTKDELDSRRSTLEASLEQYANSGTSDINYVKKLIDNFNSYYDTTVKQEDVMLQSSSLLNANNENNGKVRFNLDRKVSNPNIVFRIRADWVGVLIQSSKPQITRLKSDEFNSGEIGNIEVTVKNIGDDTGTFAISVTGCDPITQRFSAETNKFTIKENEQSTIPVQLSIGTVNQDFSKTCDVRVYDVNDPDQYDIDQVTVTVKKALSCEPNRKYIDGSCIKQCLNDEIVTLECCDYGIEVVNGDFKCKTSPSGGGVPPDDTTCDPLIKNILFEIPNPFCNLKARLNSIAFLISLLIGFLTFSAGKLNFYDNKPKKKQEPLDIILIAVVSVIVGVLIFIIVKSFFDFIFSIWGIITLIILFIAFIFFNKIKTLIGLK